MDKYCHTFSCEHYSMLNTMTALCTIMHAKLLFSVCSKYKTRRQNFVGFASCSKKSQNEKGGTLHLKNLI